MKRYTVLTIITILFLQSFSLEAQSNKDLNLFFRLSDYYLNKYVYHGMVDYKYANRYSKEIDALYDLIGKVDLSAASQNEKIAFCINTYNILVIYQVAKNYPISNPLDHDGFFDKNTHLIAGEELTLNQLEIDQMLRQFEDARFHFVLACAAKSCPQLADFAYKPENVDKLLQDRTVMTLNDDNFIRIDHNAKKIMVSKIFEWYASDFENKEGSIRNYINKFRTEQLPADYTIGYYEYDWTLNEKKS